MSKTLVAYFSVTGTTKAVAQNLAHAIGADTYEIRPKVPYTSADLNWQDDHSRSTIEMRNKASRPELADKDAKIENYSTIVLLSPIWWYVFPHIMNTFLEAYDFNGKRIILFATSGSSSLGSTASELAPSAKGAKIISGRTLNGHYTESQLKQYFDSYAQ